MKAKRVTGTTGAVQSTVELDPFGADTGRSSNAAFQPRRFTSYGRDGNRSDDAQQRRYNRYYARFEQPDPSDSSYDLADPQSFNRYAYVQNDPVNFVDPSGLNPEAPGGGGWSCSGTWGAMLQPDGRITDFRITSMICVSWGGSGSGGAGGTSDQPPAKGEDDCAYLAAYADYLAKTTKSASVFVVKLSERFIVPEPRDPNRYNEFSARGFKDGPNGFVEDPRKGTSPNQVNHYAGTMFQAYRWSIFPKLTNNSAQGAYAAALVSANLRETDPEADAPDMRMNTHSVAHGVNLRYGLISPKDIGNLIRTELCK